MATTDVAWLLHFGNTTLDRFWTNIAIRSDLASLRSVPITDLLGPSRISYSPDFGWKAFIIRLARSDGAQKTFLIMALGADTDGETEQRILFEFAKDSIRM